MPTPKFEIAPEQLADLKAKHGELAAVETVVGTCVFRCPDEAQFCAYLARARGGAAAKSDANEKLVRGCRVFPGPDEFDDAIERKPGLPKACIDGVLTLAGVDEVEVSEGRPSDLAKDAWDALLEEHGEVAALEFAVGTVVLRCPTRTEYKRFDQAEDKAKPAELARIIRACAVYPSEAAMDARLRAKPGIALSCVHHLQRLAGAEEVEAAKK